MFLFITDHVDRYHWMQNIVPRTFGADRAVAVDGRYCSSIVDRQLLRTCQNSAYVRRGTTTKELLHLILHNLHVLYAASVPLHIDGDS